MIIYLYNAACQYMSFSVHVIFCHTLYVKFCLQHFALALCMSHFVDQVAMEDIVGMLDIGDGYQDYNKKNGLL